MKRALIFLTDENTNGTAIQQLKNRGINILTCKEAGLLSTDDVEILQFAAEKQFIMITCDDDFLVLDAEWKTNNQEHCGIIYFRMPDQCTNIGIIVREILEIYALITGGAGTIEDDIHNKVWRVKA